MAQSILVLLIAFALGSFPTAFVAGKLLSRGDIRDAGSGNPGTLNAVRQYGKLVGLVVLLVDAGKGILAVIVAQAMSVADVWVYLTALSVTLGHNFSPALKFRGGKGAATVLGGVVKRVCSRPSLPGVGRWPSMTPFSWHNGSPPRATA